MHISAVNSRMSECTKQRRPEQIYKWQLQNWWATILFGYPVILPCLLSLWAPPPPTSLPTPLPSVSDKFHFCAARKQNQFPVTYSACFSSASSLCVCVLCQKLNWIYFSFSLLLFARPSFSRPRFNLLSAHCPAACRQIDDSGLFCQRVLFISALPPLPCWAVIILPGR